MRLALLLTAAACVAASSPARAGGIGSMLGQTGTSLACATESGRQLVLQGLGLAALGSLSATMGKSHTLFATVVNPSMLGAGFQPGEQVKITVIDPAACRFSVEPAASSARAPASGGKGTARSAAQIAARSGPPGLEADPPGALEFQVDGQGRPVPIRR